MYLPLVIVKFLVQFHYINSSYPIFFNVRFKYNIIFLFIWFATDVFGRTEFTNSPVVVTSYDTSSTQSFAYYQQMSNDDPSANHVKVVSESKETDNNIDQKQPTATQVLFITIIALLIFLIWMLERLRRSNKKLKTLNKQIQLQKDEINLKAIALGKVNDTLEETVSERTSKIRDQGLRIIEYAIYNSHNVRGPLSRILGLLYLFEKGMLSDQETKGTMAEIQKSAAELDNTIKKMNATLQHEDFDVD